MTIFWSLCNCDSAVTLPWEEGTGEMGKLSGGRTWDSQVMGIEGTRSGSPPLFK